MSKVTIKMGKQIVKTNYDGKVAPIDLLNGAKALIEDAQKLDGKITPKMSLALIAEAFGYSISFRK